MSELWMNPIPMTVTNPWRDIVQACYSNKQSLGFKSNELLTDPQDLA